MHTVLIVGNNKEAALRCLDDLEVEKRLFSHYSEVKKRIGKEPPPSLIIISMDKEDSHWMKLKYLLKKNTEWSEIPIILLLKMRPEGIVKMARHFQIMDFF